MRIFVVLGSIVISGMAILTGAELYAADSAETAKRKADLQRIKTEHQRRIAELKRNGTAPHRGLPQKHASSAPPTRDFRGNPVGPVVSQEPRRDFRGNQVSAVGSKGVENAVPFNAASALPPADALAHFVKTARSASSMPELLNFLPAGEAKTLQALQASYDPKQAAASRQRWRKTNPDMKEESITFLTNPPYTNRLNHLKRLIRLKRAPG